MNVTRDEALTALEAVREIEARTRRAVNLAGGGPILMIWGIVWLLGYLGGAVYPDGRQGLIWAVVNALGLAGTALVVSRLGRRVHDPIGPRIGLLWFFLVGYGLLWVWLARPEDSHTIGLMAATIAMFGYVVLGLWIDVIFTWIGLAVTALGLIGYFLLPDLFDIWMAVLGGGALFASGAYIHRRWR